MPNIWAHIQFGKEVLFRLRADQHMGIQEWKAAFQLGCQGPDFLFYDHFLPWQTETPLNKLGSLMHNFHCGPFLLSLFDEVRTRKMDDPAVAYTIGFLLHHVLDRHLHPFVFSRSGFKKWHHQRFETAMDSVILMQRAGVHTGSTPVAPEIDTAGRMPGQFATEFLRVVSKHYPKIANQITANQLDDAIAQMFRAQKHFLIHLAGRADSPSGNWHPSLPPGGCRNGTCLTKPDNHGSIRPTARSPISKVRWNYGTLPWRMPQLPPRQQSHG